MRVDLLKHNQEAYEKIMDAIADGKKKIAIAHATGTGKSYLIAKLFEDYSNDKKLVLVPSTYIGDQIIKLFEKYSIQNVDVILYQKLIKMSDEDISAMDYDVIALDEYHHDAATKVWGSKVKTLIETHTESIFFGTSATPIKTDGVNAIDELFEGNCVSDLPLSESIAKKIVPLPKYVGALYTLDDELERLRAKVANATNTKEEKQEFYKKINTMRAQIEKSYGMPIILNKNIKDQEGKYIVFCKNKKHLADIKETVIGWFKTAGCKNINSYVVHSSYENKDAEYKAFCEDTSHSLHLLFCVDMLNEGLHLANISGVLLLRPTRSSIVWHQQIGRAIEANNVKTPVIIDAVNNFSSIGQGMDLLREIKDAVAREKENDPDFDDSRFEDIDTFFVLENVVQIQEMFKEIEGRLIGNWDKKVNQCIIFYNTNGRLPNKKSENAEERILGYFLINCKSQIKNNPHYSNYKKQRLKEIPTFFEHTNMALNRFCNYLKEIKKSGRNIDVTSRYVENNYKIGEDYMVLRKQYKDGKLNSKEIDEIKECGVDITLNRWEREFENKMKLIKEAMSYGKVITRLSPQYKEVDLYNWYRNNKHSFTEEELRIINQVICNSKKKPIKMIDIKTGNVFIFSSINEAGMSLYNKFNVVKSKGSGVSIIQNRLVGHTKNPVYKDRFRFEYLDDKVD